MQNDTHYKQTHTSRRQKATVHYRQNSRWYIWSCNLLWSKLGWRLSTHRHHYNISVTTHSQLKLNTGFVKAYTHTRLTAFFSGTTRVSRCQKGKTNLDFYWSKRHWVAVASAGPCAPRSRQITMPVPHYSSFLQAGCPSCHPTSSVKALKVLSRHYLNNREWKCVKNYIKCQNNCFIKLQSSFW